MPRKEPEARKEYQRTYYRAHRAKRNQQIREARWRRDEGKSARPRGTTRKWTKQALRDLLRRYEKEEGSSYGTLAGEINVSTQRLLYLLQQARANAAR